MQTPGRRKPSCDAVARVAVVAPLATAAALLLSSGSARADDAEQFELGKNRFDIGSYEDAARRFEQMLDPTLSRCEAESRGVPCRLTDAELVERARVLLAASLIALKRNDAADKQMSAVLRANPSYAPDPSLLPPEVVDRFTEVRGLLRVELEKLARARAEEERKNRQQAELRREEADRKLEKLQKLLEQERVVQENSRLVALVPFGVGQFQNGSPRLGWVFATSEAILGATSIVLFGVVSNYTTVGLTGHDPETGKPVDMAELNSRISTATRWNRVAFGGWAAVSAIGILEAQISFVPERTTFRKRPAPLGVTDLSLRLLGAGAGVSGRF